MKKIIGDKKYFAIGINIQKMAPSLSGNSCLWINEEQIGDFTDENILGPFIRSLMRLARNYEALSEQSLIAKKCDEIFLSIKPFYGRKDNFNNLSAAQRQKLIQYDKFYFHWGENFDDWIIIPFVTDSVCKFIWATSRPKKGHLNIKCYDVDIEIIKTCYNNLVKMIPEEFWPRMLAR